MWHPRIQCRKAWGVKSPLSHLYRSLHKLMRHRRLVAQPTQGIISILIVGESLMRVGIRLAALGAVCLLTSCATAYQPDGVAGDTLIGGWPETPCRFLSAAIGSIRRRCASPTSSDGARTLRCKMGTITLWWRRMRDLPMLTVRKRTTSLSPPRRSRCTKASKLSLTFMRTTQRR
jgi:hypothetical protein